MKRPVVLVLREDCPFSRLLRESGCEVINIKVIETRPCDDRRELRERLKKIDEYDGLFFTSPVSAKVFVEETLKMNQPFAGSVYALGARAKRELEDAGFRPVFHEEANTASDLLRVLEPNEFQDKKILFLRGDKSLRTIPEKLAGKAKVDEIVVYETTDVPVEVAARQDILARLESGGIEWVCFFSPSAAESLVRQFPVTKFSGVSWAALGESTAAKARGLGLRVTYVSERSNSRDFALGLMRHIDET